MCKKDYRELEAYRKLGKPEELTKRCKETISHDRYYRFINEFFHLESSDEVINTYPKVFSYFCIYNFALDDITINSLFVGLAQGNWNRFWETDEDKKKNIDELCEELRSEVFYISDRMSWDRLIRTHWIWQRIMDRMRFGEYERNDQIMAGESL